MAHSPYKNGLAMLDNLLDGKALPDHLARAKAGVILPKVRNAAETQAEEMAAKNAAIAKAIAEKIEQSPLVAVCFRHSCACGNSWQAFGFYARKVTERIAGEGDATFTKRIDYKPSGEVITATEWQQVKESTCMACFAAIEPPSHVPGRIGQIESLRGLISTAKDSVRKVQQ